MSLVPEYVLDLDSNSSGSDQERKRESAQKEKREQKRRRKKSTTTSSSRSSSSSTSSSSAEEDRRRRRRKRAKEARRDSSEETRRRDKRRRERGDSQSSDSDGGREETQRSVGPSSLRQIIDRRCLSGGGGGGVEEENFLSHKQFMMSKTKSFPETMEELRQARNEIQFYKSKSLRLEKETEELKCRRETLERKTAIYERRIAEAEVENDDLKERMEKRADDHWRQLKAEEEKSLDLLQTVAELEEKLQKTNDEKEEMKAKQELLVKQTIPDHIQRLVEAEAGISELKEQLRKQENGYRRQLTEEKQKNLYSLHKVQDESGELKKRLKEANERIAEAEVENDDLKEQLEKKDHAHDTQLTAEKEKSLVSLETVNELEEKLRKANDNLEALRNSSVSVPARGPVRSVDQNPTRLISGKRPEIRNPKRVRFASEIRHYSYETYDLHDRDHSYKSRHSPHSVCQQQDAQQLLGAPFSQRTDRAPLFAPFVAPTMEFPELSFADPRRNVSRHRSLESNTLSLPSSSGVSSSPSYLPHPLPSNRRPVRDLGIVDPYEIVSHPAVVDKVLVGILKKCKRPATSDS